jgi:alkylation response protein AidB-like acyl-CoA dehydrogenase
MFEDLNPPLQKLQSDLRVFADQKIAPIAHDLHLIGEEIPDDVLDGMIEYGVFAVLGRPEIGGRGLGAMGIAIATEELGRAWFAAGALPARNWMVALMLDNFGTDEQKQRWLPGVLSGRLQCAHSGTEPQAGSDAANIQVTATQAGANYRIDGVKRWCTHANRADLILTLCRTSTGEKRHEGISVLVVEKSRGEAFMAPELVGRRIHTVGYHGMKTYELTFNGLNVPAANLLGGKEGQGFKQLMGCYELVRLQFAFRCIGLAQAAFEAALDYSKKRIQFGKPISQFQLIRAKLADMATQIETARQLGYSVARKYDAGGRLDLEAGMAKLFASEMAVRVCQDAMQVFGGNSMDEEYPIARLWKDSALCTVGEGTSEIQREIIARRILGEK